MAKLVTKAPPSRAAAAAQHQGRQAPAPEPVRPAARQATPAPAPAPAPAPVAAPAVHASTAVTVGDEFGDVPEFMRGDAGMGMENIRHEDMATPRIKLMQALSPELTMYDGLRPGNFLHSLAEFSLGSEFTGVPIYMEKSHILWRPRKSGGGLLARAGNDDRWSPSSGSFTVQLDNGKTVTWRMARTVAESGLALWGTSDPDDNRSQPAATQMFNFVLAFPDYPDLIPAIMTFQRSGIKEGRLFNSRLKAMAHNRSMFGLRFKFSSTISRNSAGQEYYSISITGDQYVTDPDQYTNYKNMYLSFKGMGLSDRTIEGLQDDAEDVPAGDEKVPF